MNRIALLFTTIAFALISSCSNEEIYEEHIIYASFTGTTYGAATRMEGTSWDENDAVGITGGVVGGDDAVNMQYEVSGDGKLYTNDKEIAYNGTEPVTFTAYYPYNEKVTSDDSRISFDITDQKDVDFLFARGTGSMANPRVNFEFRHCMSRMELTFVDGEGDYTKGLSYTLGDLLLTGIFNSVTGEVTANDIEKAGTISKTVAEGSNTSTLILIPYSTLGASTLNLTVTANGMNYQYALTLPTTTAGLLLSGYSLVYTIAIKDNNSTGD